MDDEERTEEQQEQQTPEAEEAGAEFDAAFAEFAGADSQDETPPAQGREQPVDDDDDTAGPEFGALPAPEPSPEQQSADAPAEKAGSRADDDKGAKQPPAPAGGEPPAPDLWANATPEQRAEVERLRQYRSSNEGRVAAYQRRVTELEREIARLSAAAPAAAAGQGGPSQQAANGFLAGDDWKAFQEEYPEVAGPLEKVLGAVMAENAAMKQELAYQSDERRQRYIDAQIAVVEQTHPDWLSATDSPQFRSWLETAPSYIRTAVERNADVIVDGNEVAHLLAVFKRDTGYGAQGSHGHQPPAQAGNVTTLAGRRKRQLEAAVAVSGKGPGAGSGPPDDFETAFNFYAAR